jgi:outer membrane protein assembly factor BamA
LTLSSITHAACVAWDGAVDSINLPIKRIDLLVNNVFNSKDPEENRQFHQILNKVRVKTKDQVIEQLLLFKVGEILDMKILQETERLLRSKPYIKDAEILPTLACDDGVVVQVKTNDNWSLQPGFSYGVSSGQSKYSFELQEKNLFGLGKNLEFKYKNGLEREEKSIRFNDLNWFGGSQQLRLAYHDNSDGKLSHVNFQDPFIALHTNRAWGVGYLEWELVNPIYKSGKVVDELGQNLLQYELEFGRLMAFGDDTYHRLNFGFTFEKSDFFNTLDFPLTELPESRNYQYPWIGYEYIKERYIELSNFNSMGRVEDVSLGHHFTARLGQSFVDSSIHFGANYQKGYLVNDENLINFGAYTNGIYQNNDLLNAHLGFSASWYHFQNVAKTFYASTTLDLGQNLFAEQMQYLGGETGLRGYPFRYLVGENKFITTLEQRFFYNWYPLKTFQFASAIFVDHGATWSDSENLEFFTNVGVGFRLVPTRTAGGQVIHIDIAVPTNAVADIDNVQLQITAKKSF